MSKGVVGQVTSPSNVTQVVFNENANSNKVSESGFDFTGGFLGAILTAKVCGANKQVKVCNSANAVAWVAFGSSTAVLASAADGVSAKKNLLTVADAVTANATGTVGTITSATAAYIANGVNAGDKAVITGGADAGTYTVLAVFSATVIFVATPGGAFTGVAGNALSVKSVTLGTFTSATSTFVTDAVTSSDTLVIQVVSADAGSFPVVTVVNETTLTVNTSSLGSTGFTGVAGQTFEVDALPLPTAFANGIMIPPQSCVTLASGANRYVRGSAATVGAYVAVENIVTQPNQGSV